MTHIHDNFFGERDGRTMKGLDLKSSTGAAIASAVNGLAIRIYADNVRVGWWDDADQYTPGGKLKEKRVPDKYLVPTKMMLMVSELSEAMEGFRKGLQDDHLPSRPMIEVEFADAIIRILDCAGHLGLDVGGAIIEKLAYNATRADHTREAREAPGGKSV